MISALRDDEYSKEFHLYERLACLNQFQQILSRLWSPLHSSELEKHDKDAFEHWYSLSLLDRHWKNVSSCSPTSVNVTSRKKFSISLMIVHYSDFEMNWSSSTRAIISPCGASAIRSVIGFNILYDGYSWCWDLPCSQFYSVSYGVRSSVLSRYFW